MLLASISHSQVATYCLKAAPVIFGEALVTFVFVDRSSQFKRTFLQHFQVNELHMYPEFLKYGHKCLSLYL